MPNEFGARTFSVENPFFVPTENLDAQLLDCDPNTDPSCGQQPKEEECNDGQDNDGDGFPDKSDGDCNEDCFDGIDNDDDGLDDNSDEDCGGAGPRGNPGQPPTGGDSSGSSDQNSGDSSGSPDQNSGDSSSSKKPSDNSNSGSRSNDDRSPDFTGFLGTARAEKSPLIISAEDVYESGHLDLDSDIKNLIILIPQTTDNNHTQQINFAGGVTIVEGTKVTWLNSDPDESHDLMIEEKDTGRQMSSDINIQYGQTSEFEFDNDGTYSYSYSGMPSVNGIIKVVAKNDVDDNSLTSSTNPILGIGLIPTDQKDSIQDRISQKDYILSTFNVLDDTPKSKAQNDSKNDLSYVMLVWAAKLFK
jgi:hypothetical protein